MECLVDLTKLNRLDNLIRQAATGNLEELAERLDMSYDNLFGLISFLKEEMRAPITYCKNKLSYVYSYIPKFYLGFERDQQSTAEMDCSGNASERRSNKIKVEIELDDDDFIFDDNINFCDLYN
jgi:hypothetical protein